MHVFGGGCASANLQEAVQLIFLGYCENSYPRIGLRIQIKISKHVATFSTSGSVAAQAPAPAPSGHLHPDNVLGFYEAELEVAA